MLQAELKTVGGKQSGKLIRLETDQKFLIGREQDCHLRPNSEAISRHHCCFTLDAYCLRLRDLGSTNGTQVNGEEIQGQIGLESGDQVSVGPLTFEVVLTEVADSVDDQQEPPPVDSHASALDDASNTNEPASETMIDIPTDVTTSDTAANDSLMSDDTTVMPTVEQQQQLHS